MSYQYVYQPTISRPYDDGPTGGATPGQAWSRFWRRYPVASGRASLSEYWWMALVNAVVGVAAQLVVLAVTVAAGAAGDTRGPLLLLMVLTLAWGLATLVPSLTLLARRLHDANFSAWFLLLILVPWIGPVALLILTLLPGNPAGIRFDAR